MAVLAAWAESAASLVGTELMHTTPPRPDQTAFGFSGAHSAQRSGRGGVVWAAAGVRWCLCVLSRKRAGFIWAFIYCAFGGADHA
jgi:hypothetical protein